MVVLAGAVSFTPLGWVAGFGLAVAIYLDDRMEETHSGRAVVAAIGAAVAATVVATLTDALPQTLPQVRPLLTLALGALALIAVSRDPVAPSSLVDSRRKSLLVPERLAHRSGPGRIGPVRWWAARPDPDCRCSPRWLSPWPWHSAPTPRSGSDGGAALVIETEMVHMATQRPNYASRVPSWPCADQSRCSVREPSRRRARRSRPPLSNSCARSLDSPSPRLTIPRLSTTPCTRSRTPPRSCLEALEIRGAKAS